MSKAFCSFPFLAVLAVVIIIVVDFGQHYAKCQNITWDYNFLGTNRDWKQGICRKGKEQSPMALSLETAVYTNRLEPLFFNYSDESFGAFENNGHSVSFTLNRNLSYVSTISGGGLPGVYIFHNFHFHWGLSDCAGSEHVIDYERAPLELHVLHFNKRYGTAGKAQSKSDGLAVISILFNVVANSNNKNNGSRPSSKIGQFLSEEFNKDNILERLQKPDQVKVQRQISLATFADGIRGAKFFRYHGSVGAPPCNESVIWTVYTQRSDIDAEFLAKLRKVELKTLAGGSKPMSNYRAIQPRNNRIVYTNDNCASNSANNLILTKLDNLKAALLLSSVALLLR